MGAPYIRRPGFQCCFTHTVLPCANSLLGPHYLFNNYLPSGSSVSGAKLVFRDKKIPITSVVSAIYFYYLHFYLYTFPPNLLPAGWYDGDHPIGTFVLIPFLLSLVPDPTSYSTYFLDPQPLSTLPFLEASLSYPNKNPIKFPSNRCPCQLL